VDVLVSCLDSIDLVHLKSGLAKEAFGGVWRRLALITVNDGMSSAP
jgi:hypothetical protein